jgi:hypothetical protein
MQNTKPTEDACLDDEQEIAQEVRLPLRRLLLLSRAQTVGRLALAAGRTNESKPIRSDAEEI